MHWTGYAGQETWHAVEDFMEDTPRLLADYLIVNLSQSAIKGSKARQKSITEVLEWVEGRINNNTKTKTKTKTLSTKPSMPPQTPTKTSYKDGSPISVAGFVFMVILGTISCIFSALPDPHPYSKLASRYMLSAFMLSASSLRLDKKIVKNLLVPIVPPFLPAKLCVYASGVSEFVVGILLLTDSLHVFGAKLCLAVLVGVFPANIFHFYSVEAQNKTKVTNHNVLLARLGIQFIFGGWARWHTK